MHKNNTYLFILLLIIFAKTNLYSQSNNINTLTVNENSEVSGDKKPLKNDVIKIINLSLGKEFSVKLNTKNLSEFVTITEFGDNVDFIKFTRDKTNALITFKAIKNGEGNLNFQIDNNNNEIVRKYLYTINVTNSIEKPNNQTKIITNTSDTNTIAKINDTTNTTTPKTNAIVKNDNMTQKQIVTIPPPTLTEKTPSNPVVKNETTESKTLAEEKSLYELASELKRTKNYTNSIDTYQNLINQYTNSIYKTDTIFDMADIYTIQKNYDNAKTEYNKIINDKTNDDDDKSLAMYSLGKILELENNQSDALEQYLKVYKSYPNTKSGLNSAYQYANLLKTTADMSEGFNILNESLSNNTPFPKKEDALMLLAQMYEKGEANIRDYKKSYDTYEKYLKEFPNGSRRKEAYDRYLFIKNNYLNIR